MDIFNGHTFIFIGAGASRSYGFPCGPKLAADIAGELTSQGKVRSYLIDDVGMPKEELEEFAQSLIDTNDTIDEIVSTRPQLIEHARYILGAKLISLENEYRVIGGSGDWLMLILKNILSGLPAGESGLEEAKSRLNYITFYTLNYDRSIEHRIYRYLRSKFCGTSEELNQRALESANNVTHPHGQIGKLSLIESEDARPYTIEFPSVSNFKEICKQLTFWDEKANEPHAYGVLNALLEGARNVIFLGFGFHQEICARFEPNIFDNKRIFTTMKTLLPDNRAAHDRALKLFENAIQKDKEMEIQSGNKVVKNVQLGSNDQECNEYIQDILRM